MPSDQTFVDANVLVYHLVQQDHEHGPPSSRLLARLRAGAEEAFLSSTAVFECIFICDRNYGIPRPDLANAIIEILSFRGLSTDHPEALVDALRFWGTQGPLSFADCFHLALAKQLGMKRIYSFDQKMNRYPGVERIEPA
jgi:predicted nucleic acid-binding protein